MLLGLDIGTRNCKVGAYSHEGALLGSISARTPWSGELGVELEAEALLDTALGIIAELLSGLDRPVEALGVTSMAEAGVLIGPDGAVLADVLGWRHPGGEEQAAELDARFGADYARITGRRATALNTVAKIRWLADAGRLPAGTWMSIAEWVSFALGGDPVGEPSLASRTGLLDVGAGAWWPEALKWCSRGTVRVPELRPATSAAGRVRIGPPPLLGAHLTVAGHDHPVAMVGAGVLEAGEVLDSCGTAEAIVMLAGSTAFGLGPQLTSIGGTISCHVVPDQAALFAPPYRSGAALSAVLVDLGIDENDRVAMCALDAAATGLAGAPLDITVMGLPDGPFAWAGDAASTQAAKWAAALQDVARTGERRLRLLAAAVREPTRVVVAGGWSRGSTARKVKEQMTQHTVFAEVEEPGTRGAALIAGVAAGVFAGVGQVPPPVATSASEARR